MLPEPILSPYEDFRLIFPDIFNPAICSQYTPETIAHLTRYKQHNYGKVFSCSAADCSF